MARTIKTFTLSLDVCSALEARAKESGEKMSRIVERGLRMALALPVERGEGDEAESATRAERTALEVLRGMPPGAYFTHEINEVISGGKNNPIGVTLRALAALARRGEVFGWNSEVPRGDVTWASWSTKRPAELVAAVIAKVGRGLSDGDRQARVFALVAALARKMNEADAAAARAALLAEWHMPDSVDVLIQTEAVHLGRERAKRQEEAAAFEAERVAAVKRAAEINAENERRMREYPLRAPVS